MVAKAFPPPPFKVHVWAKLESDDCPRVNIGKDRWLMRQIMDYDSTGLFVLFAAEVLQEG